MAYTKQNFVDGQVLTAANMNNIVEGLSRNKITSDEYIGSKDPVNVMLIPINETETYFDGIAIVQIASLTDPITLESTHNGLVRLDISPIVHAFGDTVKQVIEAKYGVSEFGVIAPELKIYELSGIISEGIYSQEYVSPSTSIAYYISEREFTYRLCVMSPRSDITQSQINDICEAKSSKFTFKFNVTL